MLVSAVQQNESVFPYRPLQGIVHNSPFPYRHPPFPKRKLCFTNLSIYHPPTRPAHYYLHVFLHVVFSFWLLKALFSTYSLAILQSPVQDSPLLRSCSGSSACSELYYIRAPTGRWNKQRRRMPLPNEHCLCLPLAICQVLPSPYKDTCAHLGNLDNFPISRSLT